MDSTCDDGYKRGKKYPQCEVFRPLLLVVVVVVVVF